MQETQPSFILPDATQRTAVMGRTGSGKTQFGAALLSHADFDRRPYIIVDYKRDDILNAIPGIQAHELGYDAIPREPGLYILHPHPADVEQMENFLWKAWEQGDCGLYFDETYMVPNGRNFGAFDALLTQGRSKRIPMICLMQRPTWVSRFVFSESNFFAVFDLTDRRDRRLVQEFIPQSIENKLPEYSSYWYDVNRNKIFQLAPVSERGTLLASFQDRLEAIEAQKRAATRPIRSFI